MIKFLVLFDSGWPVPHLGFDALACFGTVQPSLGVVVKGVRALEQLQRRAQPLQGGIVLLAA